MSLPRLYFAKPAFAPEKRTYHPGEALTVMLELREAASGPVEVLVKSAGLVPPRRKARIAPGQTVPDEPVSFQVAEGVGEHTVELDQPSGCELSKWKRTKLLRIEAVERPTLRLLRTSFGEQEELRPGDEVEVAVELSSAWSASDDPDVPTPTVKSEVVCAAFRDGPAQLEIAPGEVRASCQVVLGEVEPATYDVLLGSVEMAERDPAASSGRLTLLAGEEAQAEPEAPELLNDADRAARIRDRVFNQPGTRVFAILDGAAIPGLVTKLEQAEEENCCLFAGKLEPDVAERAPYLVAVEPRSRLMTWLLSDGWQSPWGIYAVTPDSVTFTQMRKHLRTFMMVRKFDGKLLFFRYYDPRVFRLYLPTCNADEVTKVYGPVQRFAVEDKQGTAMLIFDRSTPPVPQPVPVVADA